MRHLRVLIADQHVIIRGFLRSLLERQKLEVVGEAEDGRQAIDLAETLRPDVALLDFGMPYINGIEAARRISASLPETRVVILSMHSDESYVLKALTVGARAYLLKDSSELDIINAIHAVSRGEAFFSSEISRILVADHLREVRQRSVQDRYDLLTNREREILQLLVDGKTSKEIAADLSLSVHTIESHRSKILETLNLHGVPELILYAVRKGIIC